jgi:hypothetical protein
MSRLTLVLATVALHVAVMAPVTSIGARMQAPAGVQVAAGAGWVDAGVTVAVGDTVTLSAAGAVADVTNAAAGPEGYAACPAGVTPLVDGLPCGALLVAVAGGVPAVAGAATTLVAGAAGSVALAVNAADSALTGGFVVTATVTVASSPTAAAATAAPATPESAAPTSASGGPSKDRPRADASVSCDPKAGDCLSIQAAPTNDKWDKATTITTVPYYDYALDIKDATSVSSDPTSTCGGAGSTVWFKFTPTTLGSYLFDTAYAEYDTVVTFYTRSSSGVYTQLACNDNDPYELGNSGTSLVHYTFTSTATVYIMVRGKTTADKGWLEPYFDRAASDVRTHAIVAKDPDFGLPYASDYLLASFATTSADDPTSTCAAAGPSIWFTFTPPSSGTYFFTTENSEFDTVVSAYTYSGSTATQLGCNDDDPSAGSTGTSALTFDVATTTPVWFMVRMKNAGDSGYVAAWLEQQAPDSITAPTDVKTLPQTFEFWAGASTIGANEPSSTCGGVGETVWFRYAPINGGTFRFTTDTSDYDTVVTIYTGTPGSLTEVACNDNDGAKSTSAVQGRIPTGQTGYILVRAKTALTAGDLVFMASLIALDPTPTATPSPTKTATPTKVPTNTPTPKPPTATKAPSTATPTKAPATATPTKAAATQKPATATKGPSKTATAKPPTATKKPATATATKKATATRRAAAATVAPTRTPVR